MSTVNVGRQVQLQCNGNLSMLKALNTSPSLPGSTTERQRHLVSNIFPCSISWKCMQNKQIKMRFLSFFKKKNAVGFGVHWGMSSEKNRWLASARLCTCVTTQDCFPLTEKWHCDIYLSTIWIFQENGEEDTRFQSHLAWSTVTAPTRGRSDWPLPLFTQEHKATHWPWTLSFTSPEENMSVFSFTTFSWASSQCPYSVLCLVFCPGCSRVIYLSQPALKCETIKL